MKIILHNLKIILVFILFVSNLYSQTDLSKEKSNYNFGLSFGSVYSINNFDRLGENPSCCNSYEDGNGISLMMPFNYRFDLGYAIKPVIGANLLYDNIEFRRSDFIQTRQGLQEVINSTISVRTSIGLGAGLSYSYKNFSISSLANFNYNLMNLYSQSEELNSIDGELSENTEQRNFDNINADLANGLIGFISLKISYDIELNTRKNYISPNILIRQSIFSEHKQDNWHLTGIYFGISFKRKTFFKYSTPLEPN